ncbi:MAG: hypothetical protein E7231_11265 [Cellulosilyticum sp.]|nr:hypothetical protein [Cellulosilyticum sp.]
MYAFIDIEATGQVQSEAFQVAMVIANRQFEVQEILNFYVAHKETISPHVLELCGLKEQDLEVIKQIEYSHSGAVEVIEKVFDDYEEDEIIIIGKMIKGDIKWLRKIGVCCNRMDFMEDSQYIEINHFFEENQKLSQNCYTYGITKKQVIGEVTKCLKENKMRYGTDKLLGGNYHNALVDAYATYKLVKEIVSQRKIDLAEYIETYDWINRSYLMMNRKAMEDQIAVKIYQNDLLREIKEEYGIHVAKSKLMLVDSFMFENGCMMGVTKKEILLYLYLSEIKRSQMPYFNRYEVRVRRKKSIRKLSIVALNRLDLFIQLSKIIAPDHIPQSFEKRSVMMGLLQNPSAYLEANGYTLLSVKLKETQIEFVKVS